MSYLEMAKRASAELRKKRNNEITPTEQTPNFVNSFISSYAHPWPDTLPGLGQRQVGPFDRCAKCGSGSWVRYAATVLCAPCARGFAALTPQERR